MFHRTHCGPLKKTVEVFDLSLSSAQADGVLLKRIPNFSTCM